ncbi:hypothetical protein [Alkalihalobacillus sp. TS-13]|uniref:hypothetical protein n=1 Tax=Alkalihalobacillus sp. TS-13 TaxID=2842455 RepID=UPI001C868E36|nr:hypothetical protein [Alkalihalobacillus sp. TS-13]
MKKLSPYHELRLLYEKDIHVNHISEVFDICYPHDDAQMIKAQMAEKDYDVLGVEEDGSVIGYVKREELKEGLCRNYMTPFSPREIVSDSTPLIKILFLFKEIERIFVLEENRVTRLVTKADLQKPPIRMLLFGIITLLEMHLLRVINHYLPQNDWKRHLGMDRIQEAERLYTIRSVKNEAIGLSDCLQICDKRDIILNEGELRQQLKFPSKTKGKDYFKRLEGLRNNLAHAQELNTEGSWEDIILLIEETETILEVCEQIDR